MLLSNLVGLLTFLLALQDFAERLDFAATLFRISTLLCIHAECSLTVVFLLNEEVIGEFRLDLDRLSEASFSQKRQLCVCVYQFVHFFHIIVFQLDFCLTTISVVSEMKPFQLQAV